MGLQKEIKQDNEIILNYHRIVTLSKITNISNVLEVNSYINETEREKEKRYQELQKRNANGEGLTKEEKEELEKGINVLIEAEYISTNYDVNMTIENAYEYLKTLDKYKKSRDILEDR